LGSLIIGLAPTYASIGAFASVLLLIARLVQGLAHGGELPSAQTYISEFAPREKRGLWSSLIYVSGTVGVIAGVLMAAVFTQVMNKATMEAYGWRVPFILGGIAGIYALFMRRRMDESEVFEEDVTEHDAGAKPRIWPEIVKHRKEALQVVGMTVGFTVSYYTWAVSAPSYAISALKIDATGALWAGVFANLVFMVCLPIWGNLSDRIGRKPVMITGVVGVAALLFPLEWLVRDSAWQLFLAMSAFMVFSAATASIVPAVYAELFPTHIRTVGVGVPYSICVERP
jgi:MHS family alpha-ketoglutarate permease-like MFS transporter